MNLTLRPSGGRGEYELAGSQGALHVSDVFDLPILIEILPETEINAHSQCNRKDGKPRIRLDKPVRNSHPSSLIAAAMLLPKPRRERHECHGDVLPVWEKFVVQTIRLDVVRRPSAVLIRPVIVRIENGEGLRMDISFADRMERVLRIWSSAAAKRDPLSNAVTEHAKAFTSLTSSQSELTGSFTKLHKALKSPSGDLLPILEKHYRIAAPIGQEMPVDSNQDDPNVLNENIVIDPASARAERVRQWRLAAIRGHSSKVFRENVRSAYDSRCMFSGQKMPRTEATRSPGVDAAHILPWSRFELDSTRNGLCLSKQCHWAFDAGLFKLSHDSGENSYILSIPNSVKAATLAADFDLAPFEKMTGKIPRKHLPLDETLWPEPSYLSKLNEFLENDAA